MRGQWAEAWSEFWRQHAPGCKRRECPNSRTFWRRLRGKNRGAWIEGSWYCLEQCLGEYLESILTDAQRRHRPLPPSPRPQLSHRVPLGLMLISRHQLRIDQLDAALRAQRESGYGRIGEWLERLGFVTEHQVTVALARQWSCPVLKSSPEQMRASRPVLNLPVTLLESVSMAPIEYVESTRTLHAAFGGSIDYGVLYAIEHILECRTEPCLADPSLIAAKLDRLSNGRREREVVFHGISNAADSARIIASYSASMAPCEIRQAACGSYSWIRLLRIHSRSRRPIRSPQYLDLLFS